MRDKLLTVAEASELAGVSTASIRRWTNIGKLKTYRSGGNHRRIKTSDLMRLIDKESNYVAEPAQSYIEFLGDDITPDPTNIPPLRNLHKFLEEYSQKREENIVSSTIKF
jgi:excisionase family DNA binding protein